jgi:hypothetical protein
MRPSSAATIGEPQRTFSLSFIRSASEPEPFWPWLAPPPRPNIPDEHLRRLARQVHSLGERPLYELFREIIAGKSIADALEDYARLDAAILKYLGGDYLSDTEETAQ